MTRSRPGFVPRARAWIPARVAVLATLLLGALAPSAAAEKTAGTEFVTFWSGDLRVLAQKPNTRVTLVDVDTGDPLPLGDPRIAGVNVSSNPFVLDDTGDAFEGQTTDYSAEQAIRVRIEADDPDGDAPKPVTVWMGGLSPQTRHPSSPPTCNNAWASYLPATADDESAGRELGRELLGFATEEAILIARKRDEVTASIEIEDLATNMDADTDDSQTLGPSSDSLIHADDEILAFRLDGFEDDTLRVSANVDVSALVGCRFTTDNDWSASPPSFAAGDAGIELGTRFYTYVRNTFSIYPTQDDTTIDVAELGDSATGDDDASVTLSNGQPGASQFDFFTRSSGAGFSTRSGEPVEVTAHGSPSGNGFDGELVRVDADASVLTYVGPIRSDTDEYVDVSFSVPTGPASRILYPYAQNSGGSNDLQLFAFDPDTEVDLVSLTTTPGFKGNAHHDFQIGPDLWSNTPCQQGFQNEDPDWPWKCGTPDGEVWWGSGVWGAELLRVRSDRPVTAIGGDYDKPHFGAFIPYVRTSNTLPPLAEAEGGGLVPTGEPVCLDGSGSFDQDDVAGEQAPSWSWDLDTNADADGDGEPANDVDAQGETVQVTYDEPGDRQVKLTYADDEGQTDDDFTEVKVRNGTCLEPANPESCEPGSCCEWVPLSPGTACDDGDPATPDDRCREDGRCIGGEPLCGDGHVAPEEGCDDGNDQPGDGCAPDCTVEAGWVCTEEIDGCQPICGDGQVVGPEGCDDGNNEPGDGCAPDCTVEEGWSCGPSGTDCTPVCGDGRVVGPEGCDDGNDQPGDGCAPDCTVEEGWRCEGAPSSCTPCSEIPEGSPDCDRDDDGRSDATDNCPATPNPEQRDTDGDGTGDACDGDLDGDGVPNAEDNCPETPNAPQDDRDGDGAGDACDGDEDGDGVADTADNCPHTHNTSQRDSDGDGTGDACEGSDRPIGFDAGSGDAEASCPGGPPCFDGGAGGGCSCRSGRRAPDASLAAWLLVFALLVAGRLRRRCARPTPARHAPHPREAP